MRELSTEQELAELTAEHPLVIVDFYAPWCGPCRQLTPRLEVLAAKNRHVQLVKVNVDDAEALSNKYQVQAIPTLVVFSNGAPVGIVKGPLLNQIKQIVDAVSEEQLDIHGV